MKLKDKFGLFLLIMGAAFLPGACEEKMYTAIVFDGFSVFLGMMILVWDDISLEGEK